MTKDAEQELEECFAKIRWHDRAVEEENVRKEKDEEPIGDVLDKEARNINMNNMSTNCDNIQH